MRWVTVLCLVLGFDVSAQEIAIRLPRHAFYRGEVIPVSLHIPAGADGTRVEALLDGQRVLEATMRGTDVELAVPTAQVRTGEYVLKVVALVGGAELAASEPVLVARRPAPDRFEVCLWSVGATDCTYYFDHGFTIAGGPGSVYHTAADAPHQIRYLDDRLARGVYAMVTPCGGIRRRELKGVDPEAEDVAYKGAGRNADRYFNPFSPIVERVRSETNREFMRLFGFHPAVRIAFINSEVVDDLWLDNLNREGIEITRRTLGFTRDEIGDPNFVAPGVISDDDRGYRFQKYVYTIGNGLSYANRRASEDIKQARPDVLVLTDPYRQVTYLNMFPGIDIVSTWTYTNNDPKLMLYVETLRAVTRGTGQQWSESVTLLNYPGTIAPRSLFAGSSAANGTVTDPQHRGWMLMGPDRCKEVSWIVLSRAPKMIGYYFGSPCDPQRYSAPEDQFRVPHATSDAIKELSDRVFQPYGPLITRLSVAPRRIAVLSSQASRLYGKYPRTIGYPNEQIYGFYSVLAMAHLDADVVFDEQIESGALKDYDVLAMPFCGVVTKRMYDEILAFVQRGGLVLADASLGPAIPGAVKFDFDFSYRPKVSADAIESGVTYADWDDHLNPDTAALAKAKGVTAEEDQKIMESYARQLRERLAGKVEPTVWTDSPRALVNVLEKDGVRYLVLINDHRAYDDRTGPFKAIMAKLLPQTVAVSIRASDTLFAYDMLERRALDVSRQGDTLTFRVALDALGGKIIALWPAAPDTISVQTPDGIARGDEGELVIAIQERSGAPLRGLQPVQVAVLDPGGRDTEYSGYYCAENGRLAIPFRPASNDRSGEWKVHVEDLTAGLTRDARWSVR